MIWPDEAGSLLGTNPQAASLINESAGAARNPRVRTKPLLPRWQYADLVAAIECHSG
ncbi:hypothetical protein [Streptomyces sp. WAC05858]|uniref:hypothetical protein n=1 Tax=Streptomyces TaxID=1883 RepID=UPI00163C6688|nr:hypothetical protein [Streptomyces sp. WAC05858]